jgi:hypothetical protein
MSVSRRALLKGSVAAGAAGALPAFASSRKQPLTLFDSRIPESRAFARRAKAKLDIAQFDATHWAALRGEVPSATSVKGLTGWSDWVIIRGLLEERGLRMRSENNMAAPLSGSAHLFVWEMA